MDFRKDAVGGGFGRVRHMHAKLLLGAMWSVFFALWPSAVSAQSIGIAVTEFGDRSGDQLTQIGNAANGVSAIECAEGTNITFTVGSDNVGGTIPPGSPGTLTAWRFSASGGADCSTVAARNPDSLEAPCTPIELGDQNQINNQQSIEVTLPIDDVIDCENRTNAVETIYFIPLNNIADEAGAFGTINIAVSTSAPNPPSLDATSLRGGTSVPVSWATSGENIREYQLFLEAGGCENGTPSGELQAVVDAAVDSGGGATLITEPPEGVVLKSTVQGTGSSGSVTLTPELSLEAPGNQGAIGVVAIDQAGNVSVPAIACVTRVETEGFCTEELCEGCSVSRVTSARNMSQTWAWMIAVFAMLVAARFFSKPWRRGQ